MIQLIKDLKTELSANSLWHIYRAVYKNTPCGPMIGFLVNNDWVYGSDLSTLTFDQIHTNNIEVNGVSVSSIVEGSDAEVNGDKLYHNNTIKDFWKLVESVNKEASFLWERDNSNWLLLLTDTMDDDINPNKGKQ